MENIKVLPTDKASVHSPEAGHPLCICCRCGNKITEEEEPIIRLFTTNAKGEVDKFSFEYRYCDKCAAGMGVHKMPEGSGQHEWNGTE